ncbi:MAG: hypothetical protein IT374_00435 [Polyangiaceae bacterium]|nr:hypothetical protein [Polyangiaceae bacterium]
MRPHLPLGLPVALVAGCGGSPPAASPPAPVASVEVPAVAVEPSSDPRTVRCGVDDRPRSVVSSTPLHPAPRARVAMKPALEIAPLTPPTQQPSLATLPRVTAAVEAPAGSFSTTPDLDPCEGLAVITDAAPLAFPVALSTEGAPLRVGAPAAAVSPYARCVQERLCGLAGGPRGTAMDVRVSVRWNYARRLSARAAPAGGDVGAPRVVFEHPLPKEHARHAFGRVLSTLAHHAGVACGSPGQGASVLVTLTLDENTKIAAARVEPTGPEVPPHLSACISARMTGESLPTPPPPRPPRDVALVLDW